MQISFSIASGISTKTRRMDESFAAMPDGQPKDGASRLDQQPYYANGQVLSPNARRASYLRQMEEQARDSPTVSAGEVDERESIILRNENSALSLGYRQPDNPVQLISYIGK